MFTFKKRHDLGFLLIGLSKIVKGTLLLAIGIGAFSLINRDLTEMARHWAGRWQMDLDSHFMQKFLARLITIDKHDMRLVAGTSVFYSMLMFTEGFGLVYEKVWAEYMTFIVTASFIPFEAYKLVQHATWPRLILTLTNSLAAGYIAWRLHQRALIKQKLAAIAASHVVSMPVQ